MSNVDVSCEPGDAAWRCQVRVGTGPDFSEHWVTVPNAVLDRLDPAATDPTDLVLRSFQFLLEREAKESILRSFDLPMIGRFFPEYEETIRRSNDAWG